MSREQFELYPLNAEDRDRLAEPVRRALAQPDEEAADLREVVRDIAHRARGDGWGARALIQTLRNHVDSMADEDLPFVTYNRVLERIVLWTLTVYHRPDFGGQAARSEDTRTSA